MASFASEVLLESTPISLYIALEPGRRADLEIISRAAIAWSEAIREAAFITDPFLEVRVELLSGTESSINLNSRIRAVREAVKDPKKLRAIAWGIAAYFAMELGSWVVGKGYDAMWSWVQAQHGTEVVQTLSPAEKREVEEMVTRILAAKSAGEKAKTVYRELINDDAVTGVGVSLKSGERPPFVVPRSQFPERAGIFAIEEETIQRRTETDRIELTLVAPELSGDENKWKFSVGAKTVWAKMADPDFLERLKPGSNSAPRMVTGLRMDADLETVQESRDGVWTIVEQRVLKVHRLSEPVSQPAWLNAPVDREEP